MTFFLTDPAPNFVSSRESYTVLLVGAGQLGSRYLQGLVKCKFPLKIYVQDVHTESLVIAEQRWREVFDTDSGHEITFRKQLRDVEQSADIAILATTADVRPNVLAETCKHCRARYWILEKVLAQSESGLDKIRACLTNDSKAWVNTPRRIMLWHQQLKARLRLNLPLTVTVVGGSWGLACNAVHFLDLVAWWTGETLDEVTTDRLDSAWFPSKRQGNWEISGTLDARFSAGSRAHLTADMGDRTYTIQVSDGSVSWQVDEAEGVAICSDGTLITGRLPYQSDMSPTLVEEILATGGCGLPTLAESVSLHRPFIRGMQDHWNRYGNFESTFVPIT